MNLALRPYVTAGVAIVGAGVIAATPVAAPPPAMQSHSVQLSAAIDNPIEVFAPVVDKAGTFIQTVIQNETTTPLPIVNAVIAKGIADGKTIGEIATALTPIVSNLITGFPVTLQTAAQKAAAGDLDGALGSFVGLFFGPVFLGFMQYIKGVTLIQDQFDVAKRITGAALYQTWGTVLGTALAGFVVATTTAASIEAIGTAVTSGDPANVVNAAQHGVANVASALIGAADTTVNLNIALARKAFADAINPPPPEPEELTAAVTPKALAPSLPAASSTVELPPAEMAAPEDSMTRTTTTLVRDSAVAVPGKVGTRSSTSKPAAKVSSDVRDEISATVNKIGDGVKKAFAKPEKKSATVSAGSSDDSK